MAREKTNPTAEKADLDLVEGAPEAPVGDPRDTERAELYFATVRLIDTVTKRGTFEGGELLTVGAIRQRYVDWLVGEGFIQPEQRQQG